MVSGRLQRIALALDDDAKSSGGAALEKAAEEARLVVGEAQSEAARVVREAREEGEAAGALLVFAARAAARRDAREIVLAAREDAYGHLRRAVLEELERRNGTDEMDRLNASLEHSARELLGSAATVRRDGAGLGLVAESGNRRVEVSAERLVDTCLTELGEALERLWS